jgi:hypothetical protein
LDSLDQLDATKESIDVTALANIDLDDSRRFRNGM